MAPYTQYGKDGLPIEHHDLQDKAVWCKDGASTEEVFVEMHGGLLGIQINPEKENDPYAPDLISTQNQILGDLKTQNTPFFKSESLYGIPPRYAVVFNLKDRRRYNEKYPNIEIFYWVDWVSIGFEMGSTRIDIEPLIGVWKIAMPSFNELLDKSPVHSYQQRRYDTKGNAKGSYVFDIRDERFQKLA
jgi:hypothetical protein